MIKELESFSISLEYLINALKISKKLWKPMKGLLKYFLVANLDEFAWKHGDTIGIDPKVACHALKLDPKIKPKIKRRQPIKVKRIWGIKE